MLRMQKAVQANQWIKDTPISNSVVNQLPLYKLSFSTFFILQKSTTPAAHFWETKSEFFGLLRQLDFTLSQRLRI